MPDSRRSLRFLAGLAGLSLLSCGREVTGPGDGIDYGRARVAAMRLEPAFPAFPGADALSDLIPFTRVRVVLRRPDGGVAKDTVVSFPSGVDSVALALDVPLPVTAPDTGLTMGLSLAFINAQGDTVFRGGPSPVTARPGSRPAVPIVLPVQPVYPGGVVPASVTLTPATGTAVAGTSTTFSAVVRDGQGNPLAGIPVFYAPEDSTRASVPNVGVPLVQWRARRGTARVIARVAVGSAFVADTSAFDVSLPASLLLQVSGGAQSGTIGTALAQPLVFRVVASDSVPVAGVRVDFAVTTGGGTLGAVADTSDAAGLVSVGWTLGATVGSQSVTATIAGVPAAASVMVATGTPPVPTQLAITSAPTTVTAGAALAPVVVEVREAGGAVTPLFTGPVTLALSANGAGATLGGTTTVNAVAGVATFAAATIDRAATGLLLVASSGALAPDTSAALAVTAAAAAQLATVSGDAQSGTVLTALPQPFVVRVTDAFGNPVSGVTVTWAVTSGTGVLAAPTSATNAGGEASNGLTLPSTPGAVTVQASVSGLAGSPRSFGATALVGAASQLVFTANPGAGIAGQSITPAWTVEARDGLGNPVPTFTGAVTVALGGGPGGGTLSGTTTVNAVAGIATFAGLSVDRAGAGWTLTATSAGLTDGTSAPFSIGAAAAASIAVVAGNGQTGPALLQLPGQVTFRTSDAFGNPTAGTAVTIAVTSGGGSIGTASGATNAAGELSTTWTLGGTLGAQSVTATVTAFPTAQAIATATATAGLATQLAITSGAIADVVAGTNLPDVVIEVRDGAGNLVPTFTGTVYGHIDASPLGPAPDSVPAVAVAGVATFSAINFSAAGTYQLRFSSPGLTDVLPNPFDVLVGPPAFVFPDSVAPGDGQSATVGTPLPLPLRAGVHDTEANPVAGVPVVFTMIQGTDTVRVDTVPTNAVGIASVTPTMPPTAGPVTIRVTSNGLTGSGFVYFATALPGTATRLVVVQQPANAVSLASIPPTIVQAQDAGGNLVTSFTGPVTVVVDSGPQVGWSLGGTQTVIAVAGVTDFSGLTLNTAGQYRWRFTSPGLTTAVSDPFVISVGAPATLAIVGGDAQAGAAFATLADSLAVRLSDAAGNAIAGATVTWSVQFGGGSVSPTTRVTDSLGVARTAWTLGSTVGTQGARASAFALTADFTATAAAAIANITWTGTVSTAWDTGANWSGAVVPAATDSVRIPAGTPFAPVLGSNVAIARLRVEAGTTVNTGDRTLDIGGTLEVEPGAAITGDPILGGPRLTGTGTLRGAMQRLTLQGGAYATDGALDVTFDLSVLGGTLAIGAAITTVGGNFATIGTGALEMTAPATLDVGGDAVFAGGSTAGRLTAGTLILRGGLTQAGGAADAFAPSAGHTLTLAGSGPQTISFATPDTARTTSCAASCIGTFDASRAAGSGALTFTSDAKVLGPTQVTGDSLVAPGRLLLASGAPQFNAGVVIAGAIGWQSGLVRTAGPFLVDTLVVWGGGGTLIAGEVIPTRVESGIYAIAGAHPASLTIAGTGVVDVVGSVTLGGGGDALVTRGQGRLTMRDAGDTLSVTGSAFFGGQTTAGTMTDGVLAIAGDFAMTNEAQPAFIAEGAHRTRILGTNAVIDHQAPNGSQFAHLDIDAVGPATFNGDATITGTVTLGPSTSVVGGPNTATIGGNLIDAVGSRWQVSATRFLGPDPTIPPQFANSVDFAAGLGLDGPLTVGGTLTVSGGELTLAGRRVETFAFQTLASGYVRMSTAADTLVVAGNASFAGATTDGNLIDGVLLLGGNLDQSVTPSAFAASGAHRTVLTGGGDQTVTFADPGYGAGSSHFASLVNEQSLGSARVVLGSSVPVAGMLVVPSRPSGTFVGGPLFVLGSLGADVRGATFEGVRWELGSGAPVVALDSIRFTTQDPSLVQFRIARESGTLALTVPTFTTTPDASGRYLVLDDVDGAASGTLQLTVSAPTPSAHGGSAVTVNGALLAGWPGFAGLTWSGATSAAWTDAANWLEGLVPAAGDSVRIPASGVTNLPFITASHEVRALVNENAGALAIDAAGSLRVNERVVLRDDVAGVSCPLSYIDIGVGDATVRGRFACGVRVGGNGTVTLDGNMTIEAGRELGLTGGSTFDLGGHTASVAGDLVVLDAAVLRMDGPTDSLAVGNATLGGGSTAGTLTAGALTLRGTLFVQNPSGFLASGAHRTRFLAGLGDTVLVRGLAGPVSFGSVEVARPVSLDGEFGTSGEAFVNYGGAIVGPNGRLTVGGPLVGTTGTLVAPRVVALSGVLADTGTFRPDTTIFLGAGQVMPFRVGASAIPQYRTVRINGTVTPDFTGGIDSLAGSLLIPGEFAAAGVGQPGDLRIAGDLLVTGAGRLVSSTFPHAITVHGSATFEGADAEGALQGGTLNVSGDFRQFATSSPRSFRPAPDYIVRLEAGGLVAFDDPVESFFGRLEVNQSGTVRTFATDVTVAGVLRLGADAGATFASNVLGAGGTRTLTARGLEQTATHTFRNVALRLVGDSAITTTTTLTFQDFDPAAIQVDVLRDGGTVTLYDPVFTTAPSGAGRYLRATDTAPADASNLVVAIDGAPTPAFHGGFAQAVAPATLTGWDAAVNFRWTGNAGTGNWSTAANWANGQVPTATDSVFIPSTLVAPLIPTGTTLRALVSTRTESAIATDGSLTITERLSVPTTTGLACSGALQFSAGATPAAARGRVACFTRALTGTLVIADTLIVDGNDLQVEGSAVLDAQAGLLEVQGQFSTLIPGGTLRMMADSAHVRLLQGATFSGGSTEGLLMAGLLEVGGNFSQNNTRNAFAADGTHVTRFIGSVTQAIVFSDPGEITNTSHFAWLEIGQPIGLNVVRLDSDVFALGQLRNGVLPRRSIVSAPGATLVAHGTDLSGALFSNVTLEVRDGRPVDLLSNIEFELMDPTVEQLRVRRAGGIVAASGLLFNDVPTTGAYIRAEDTDGPTANGALVVSLAGTTPASHGGRVRELNGATITGWGVNDPATVNSWTGAGGDGIWFNNANWSLGRTPLATDSVVVESPQTITINGAVIVGWLMAGFGSSPTLQLTGGTLQVDSAVFIGASATFRQTGGLLTGDGVVTVLGAFDWNGGTASGAGGTIVQPSGAATIATTAPITLDSRTLVVSGTVQLGGAGLAALNVPVIAVSPSGVLDLVATTSFFDGNGQVQLQNSGTLRKRASAATVRIDWPIVLSSGGRLVVEDDSLDLRNTLTLIDGAIDIAASATLAIGGELTAVDTVLIGNLGVLALQGGGISTGPGNHQFTSTAVVRGAGTLRTVNANTVVLGGQVDIGALVHGNGTLNVTSADTVRIGGGAYLGGGFFSGSSVIGISAGTYTGGTFTLGVGNANGTGTFHVAPTGTFVTTAGGLRGWDLSVAGVWNWDDGGNFSLLADPGNPTDTARVFIRPTGQWRINHGATARSLSGSLNSPIDNQGLIVKTGGTATTTISNQRVANIGTIDVQLGGLTISLGCTVEGTVTGAGTFSGAGCGP